MIASVGPVVGEDEVKAESHGIIIIQMIVAKTLKGKTRKRGRGGNQSRGRGCGYNPQQGQQPTYNQNYQPSQGTYPYMAPPPMPPQNLIQPPRYDPNWQLRQTQFYNSPPVTGQYGQNQYPQSQQQVPYNRDRQSPRTSKQAQHICELCGNRGHYDYQCQFANDFMQRMQKAFQRSYYMHDTNQDQEWSQGDDHNDQEQPFQ